MLDDMDTLSSCLDNISIQTISEEDAKNVEDRLRVCDFIVSYYCNFSVIDARHELDENVFCTQKRQWKKCQLDVGMPVNCH